MGFEEFLTAELDSFSGFARALTGSRDEAHDVLADVLEKCQRQWPRISRLEYPRAYVRQMIVHRFLSDRRLWARRMIHPFDRLPVLPVEGGQSQVDNRQELDVLVRELPK